jgi:hypothetical protein
MIHQHGRSLSFLPITITTIVSLSSSSSSSSSSSPAPLLCCRDQAVIDYKFRTSVRAVLKTEMVSGVRRLVD